MVCDWWISISFVCFCISGSVACDRIYDWRQGKTQLGRRLLNFRVRVFLKSAVADFIAFPTKSITISQNRCEGSRLVADGVEQFSIPRICMKRIGQGTPTVNIFFPQRMNKHVNLLWIKHDRAPSGSCAAWKPQCNSTSWGDNYPRT